MVNVVWTEGFDHYADITGTIYGLFSRWSCGFSPQLTLVTPENSDAGQQLNLHAGGGEEDVYAALGFTMTDGTLAFQYTAVTVGGDTNLMTLCTGTSRQICLRQTSTGAIKAYSGNFATLLGTSAAGVIPNNVACCIEWGFKIHDTLGTIDVWVNGVNVLHLTGLDTHIQTNANIDTVEICEGQTDARYDHMALWDTSATILDPGVTTGGFFKIKTLVPNADKSNTGYTADTGATLYTQIDTILSAQGDTHYIQGSAANDEFLVNFEDLAAGQIVKSVTLIGVAKKDATDSRSIKLQQEQGGTKVLGSSQTLVNGTYGPFRQIFNTDANVAGWDSTKINSATFGSKSV